jgi:hypothetical protein
MLKRMKRIDMYILFLLFFCSSVGAATYYIDYAQGADTNSGLSKSTPWKRAPGMPGFSGSYTHTAGDRFIFKGGVTWPRITLPFVIQYSGSATAVDEYTSDRTWYSGTSFALPTFNAEGAFASVYSGIIEMRGIRNVKIDSLALINVGVQGQFGNGRGIIVISPENVEISNCLIRAHSNHGIVGGMNSGESASKLYIHDNELSHMGNHIEMGAPGGGASFTDLRIYRNRFHDPKTQLIQGDHGDGIHIFVVDNSLAFRDVKIYSNRFYGDFSSGDGTSSNTAQIFIEDSIDGAEIYNNLHSFTSTYTSFPPIFTPGVIALYGSRNIKVYSNTIVGDAIAGQSDINQHAKTCIVVSGSQNIDIKNNVCSKARSFIGSTTGSSLTSDYNLIDVTGSWIGTYIGSFKYSVAAWQDTGNDLHSSFGNVGFASPATDGKLSSGSPGINRGTALGSAYAQDILGNSRPFGSGWDIGAFEYGGICTPSCTGRQCGDNGCGGSCGTCITPLICNNGRAQTMSRPGYALTPIIAVFPQASLPSRSHAHPHAHQAGSARHGAPARTISRHVPAQMQIAAG